MPSNTLSTTELARKRARDRKSQAAMRDRTKWSLAELQARVTYLTDALASSTESFQDEISRLKAENQRLKHQLEESKFVGSDMCLENFTFPPSDSALSYLPMPRPLPQRRDSTSLNPGSRVEEVGLQIYERVPLTCPSTCLSDRILQNYIETRRTGTSDVAQVVLSEQPAWLPDINALLTPNAVKLGSDNRSVSAVVSDILLSYNEINTLPRKVAVLYIMYKLLNWLIYRTQSTYDQMPGWLRPEPIQIQVPHPSWIDRIPWPHARTYLISHPEITFDDFAMVYSSTFDVSWPYNPSHIIETNNTCTHTAPTSSKSSMDGGAGRNCADHGISLNPVYEQHLRQLKNWTVGDKFRRKFPELSAIIDQDSLLEFCP